MNRTFAIAVFSCTIVFYSVFAQDISNDEFLTAIKAGNETIVERLIREGVNVNITDEDGLTALHFAASNGYEKIVNLLIRNSADINAKDTQYHTPLHSAALKGRERVAELLIRNGAEINARDSLSSTPLHYASWRGHEKVADVLIRNGADVNAKDEDYDSPLHYSAEEGHEKVAEILIQNGADIDAKSQFWNTPLHCTATEGHEKVTAVLIKSGANINAKDKDNEIPLHYAALNGHEKVAELLIRNGTDLNGKGRYEYTPLHYAASNGHENVAELLIQYGADINAKDVQGRTPLHFAVSEDFQQMVELFVHKNAIVTAKNKKGETPIDWAIERGFTKIADLLKENRAARKACGIYESKVIENSSIAFENRILDGEDALPGEFPWMAALGYMNSQYKITFRCGGTIISDEFVLTAAHCVLGRELPVIVRLGTLYLTDDSATDTLNRQYKEIIKHPNYSPSKKKNDIALIRLSERIVFTEFIKPACLQTDLRDENSDVKLIVTGWGVTSTERRQKSEFLLKADLNTMALSECNATLRNYSSQGLAPNLPSLRNGIDQSQYCAYDPKSRKDSCQGDSGGPLQLISDDSHLAKVIGVISFGIGCGGPLPSIYTRIAHYIDWIEPYVWPNENIALPLCVEQRLNLQ